MWPSAGTKCSSHWHPPAPCLQVGYAAHHSLSAVHHSLSPGQSVGRAGQQSRPAVQPLGNAETRLPTLAGCC